jgi:hypothetical protein
MLLVFMFSAFLCGCATVDVKRDYDPSVDFRSLRTYAWQQKEIEAGPGQADNSLINDRVIKAVDAVLSGKGFEKNPEDMDFLVTYDYAVTKDASSGTSSSISMGGAFSRNFGMGFGIGHSERNNEVEILSIDLLNPETGKLIWHGAMEQEYLRPTDPNQSAEDIRAMAERILSKFPPKPNQK